MNARNPATLFIFTLVLAYCSIVYELLLAQSLTSVMGNTVFQYNITIGIYITALGIGFIGYRCFSLKDALSRLIRVEIMLALVGAASPFIVLLADSSASNLVVYVVSYGLIVLIGVLSGFELPLLMDLSETLHAKSSIKILGVDYLGSMLGIIISPLFLLSTIGIFGSALLTGLLNACVALALCMVYQCGRGLMLKCLSAAVVGGLASLFIFHADTIDYTMQNLYIGL